MTEVTGNSGGGEVDVAMRRNADPIGQPQAAAVRPVASSARKAAIYLASAFAISAGALGLVMHANRQYAPEYYQPDYMETVADAFENGESYGVFDLNINIRKLREEHLKRITEKPGIVVLGASQWQEASADLIPGRSYLNNHVHRDYYEDVLGMVELLVRHDKLPKDLVITVRDRIFTPVSQRTDFLWLPGIPYYQAMAQRLSLPRLGLLEAYPLQRPRELLSLAMLFSNATRWHNAKELPGPTSVAKHATLDVLNPDGSITWSAEHRAIFTQDRARKLALAHAEANRLKPPVIDPKGVEAFDRLLSYLAVRNVRVHLAHPPFNPIYFDRVQDSPYMEGLRAVEAVTRELAAKHKLGLVGSFDPEPLGCTAEMYIDAEHSGADCLRKLLGDVANSIDLPAPTLVAQIPMGSAPPGTRLRTALMSTGWGVEERSPNDAVLPSAPTVPASSLTTLPVAVTRQEEQILNPREIVPAPLPSLVAEKAAPSVRPEPVRVPEPPTMTAVEAAPKASHLSIPQRPARTAIQHQLRKPDPTRVQAKKSERAAVRSKLRVAPVQQKLVWPGDAPIRYR